MRVCELEMFKLIKYKIKCMCLLARIEMSYKFNVYALITSNKIR